MRKSRHGAVVCLFLAATGASWIAAQGTFGDIRNLIDRGSKTHTDWTPPRSLAAWKPRKLELRNQILAASGLLPAPARTPLHIRRFGRIDRNGYSVETVVFDPLPGLSVAGVLSRSRILADLFQLGAAYAPRPVFRGDHLTFHMSDDANRVQDILTAIAFVAQEDKRQPVQLECFGGEVIPLCHVAAALSPVPLSITADGSQWKPVSIPGFARLGGIDAVIKRRVLAASATPTN